MVYSVQCTVYTVLYVKFLVCLFDKNDWQMSMKLSLYGIMSVQCLNHTGAIGGLTILLSKIKLQNFQDRVNMLYGTWVWGA